MKIKIVLLIILLASPSRAQKNEYSTASISDSLKENKCHCSFEPN
jgi:hypothetical protein